MTFTSVYPDLWDGAKNYFKMPNGRPAPFAHNCRLMFYIYGNWTIREIYQTEMHKALGRAHQIMYSSHGDYILDAKRGPMQRVLKELIDAIDDYDRGRDNGGNPATLEHLLTTAGAINDGGMTNKRRDVKRKGFMFPVNHIDGTNNLPQIQNLFDTNGDDFLGNFNDVLFHKLLTNSYISLTNSQQTAIRNAKALGVIQMKHNKFQSGETPHSLYEEAEDNAISHETADNDMCCDQSTNTCIHYTGTDASYCEHAEDGYCNSMSDVC